MEPGAGRNRASTAQSERESGLRVVDDGKERGIDTTGTTEQQSADSAQPPVEEVQPAGRPQANARFSSRKGKGPLTPEQEAAEAALRAMWEEFKASADPTSARS